MTKLTIYKDIEIWSENLKSDYHSFANGIELDPSGDFLLFCESGRARLHKLHLSGPAAGTSEVFIDSLPGIPDNIK